MNQFLVDNLKILLKIINQFSLDELPSLRLINSQFNSLILEKLKSLSSLKLSSNKACLPLPTLFPSLTSIEFEYCQVLTDKKGVNKSFVLIHAFLRALPFPKKVTTLVVKNFRVKCQIVELEFWHLLNFHFINLTHLTFISPLSPIIQPAFTTTILPLQTSVFARLDDFSFISKLHNCSPVDFFNSLLLLSPKLKRLHLTVNWRTSPSSLEKFNKNASVHLIGKWAESCSELANRLNQIANNKTYSLEMSLYDIFAVLSKFNKLTSLKLHIEANSVSALMLNFSSTRHDYFFSPLNNLTFFEFYLKVNTVTEVIEALSTKQEQHQMVKTEDFPFNLAFFGQFIPQILCPNLKVMRSKFILDGTTFEKVNERL